MHLPFTLALLRLMRLRFGVLPLLQVPRLVSLLAESFNAHMRFGSCLAIGISCAGTGSREAMDVLEPMMEDVVDFVRQVGRQCGMSCMLQTTFGIHCIARAFRYKFRLSRLGGTLFGTFLPTPRSIVPRIQLTPCPAPFPLSGSD